QEAQFIVDTVTKYPHKDGEPFVAISGSEYPAFYPLNDKLDKVSIQAAEMIFVKLDGQMDGYYKTDVRVFNHSGELLAERHYDLGDRNGGLFNLLVEDERQIDNALQLSQYLPKDEQMNLLDRIDKQMEVDSNYAMAYPEVKESRMATMSNRGVFFERLQQQILQQDKTVEQHLSDLVDEVVEIANQHNQEQVLNEYMQLKADIRENETQQSEIWGSEEFVDEMKSLQEKHDKLMLQKTQIEKDYPTIWQDAERLEQQQMAEIGQADQDNSEIIKNTEFGRQAEKIFQSTAENLQKIENTADERNKDILSKHSVYIEALKKDFQYWVDIGDYDKATERLGDIRINQQMFDKRIEQTINKQDKSLSGNLNTEQHIVYAMEHSQPERFANSFDTVREQALDFINKEIVSRQDGLRASVSGKSLNKMLSGKAVAKSSDFNIHLLAVANVDKLFENAIHGWTVQDKNRDTNIAGVQRRFAPLIDPQNGEMHLVKLSIKELTNNQGNRIYTVEDIDIEKNHRLVPDLIDADSKIGLTSNRHHETDIDSLIQNIENFNSRQ
ncbi:MAG: hypothetical protein IJQ55_02660, partial [Alphaproteobacteria bacterium]|nr:hypothetical protein [Alphaproteobacteria bacterium]